MSNSRNSRWKLFEVTIPVNVDLDLDIKTIEMRLLELDDQAACGILLTHEPNFVQHHISCVFESLSNTPDTLRWAATVEPINVMHKAFRGQAEYCRALLIPAFYGVYLQDKTLLNIGSEYWAIESRYLSQLKMLKDARTSYRFGNKSNKLSKRQRAQYIDCYLELLKQFLTDTFKYLEQLRRGLPRPDCARYRLQSTG